MSEGVSLSTEDGILVFTNPAEDRMFGYAPGEPIGQMSRSRTPIRPRRMPTALPR